MKFTLKDYQSEAVLDVLTNLKKAAKRWSEDGDLHAFSLSATTGAGKTVMAAAVFEALFHGDDDYNIEPDPGAVVLWFSDDPSLNEQTRFRLLEAADRIGFSDLVVVENTFNAETFAPGKVVGCVSELLCCASYEHRVEVACFVWNIKDHGILQQPGFLYAERVHLDVGENAPACGFAHGLLEPVNSRRDAPHDGDRRDRAITVDEPLHDRGSIVTVGLAAGAHPPVRLVEYEVEVEVRVLNGVANGVPNREGAPVGAEFGERVLPLSCRLFVRVVAAGEEAVAAELLGVEEVRLGCLRPRPGCPDRFAPDGPSGPQHTEP